MTKITITKESVNAYKQLMTDPKKHGLDFEPLDECFEETEYATAKHILFDQYVDKIKKPLPKVFFYIIMDEIYSERIAKSSDGNIGYKLKLK